MQLLFRVVTDLETLLLLRELLLLLMQEPVLVMEPQEPLVFRWGRGLRQVGYREG